MFDTDIDVDLSEVKKGMKHLAKAISSLSHSGIGGPPSAPVPIDDGEEVYFIRPSNVLRVTPGDGRYSAPAQSIIVMTDGEKLRIKTLSPNEVAAALGWCTLEKTD